MYVSKDPLNHFLVHSSAKNSLRRAKNEAFSLVCILVDRPMGEDIARPPLATLLLTSEGDLTATITRLTLDWL